MGACSAQKYPAAEGFGFPTFRVKGLGLNSYFYFLSFGRRGCFKFELGGGSRLSIYFWTSILVYVQANFEHSIIQKRSFQKLVNYL